jgi:hypothetical protein
VVRRLMPSEATTQALPPALAGMVAAGHAPRGYACTGTSCRAPAESAEAWRETLAQLAPELLVHPGAGCYAISSSFARLFVPSPLPRPRSAHRSSPRAAACSHPAAPAAQQPRGTRGAPDPAPRSRAWRERTRGRARPAPPRARPRHSRPGSAPAWT